MSHMNDTITIYIPNASGAIECRADIVKDGDGFMLSWDDFVANDWRETCFPTLGAALARVALLAECGATNWARGFNHDVDAHVDAWSQFAAKSLD